MPKLLTTKQAAEFLSLEPQTLAAWRMEGVRGPPWIKLGFSVRYRVTDLEKWLEANTHQAADSVA